VPIRGLSVTGCAALRTSDLETTGADLLKVALTDGPARSGASEDHSGLASVLHSLFLILEEFDLPSGWTNLDATPTNIFVDDNAVRFIDLDESCIAWAPLSAGILLQALARNRTSHIDHASLDRAVAHEWGERIPRQRLTRFSRLLPTLDLLVRWERYEREMANYDPDSLVDLKQIAAAHGRAQLREAVRFAAADLGVMR